MKISKRLLTVVLAIVLAISSFTVAFAAAPSKEKSAKSTVSVGKVELSKEKYAYDGEEKLPKVKAIVVFKGKYSKRKTEKVSFKIK